MKRKTKSLFEEFDELEKKAMEDVIKVSIKINKERRKEAELPRVKQSQKNSPSIIVKTKFHTAIQVPNNNGKLILARCA